MTALDPNVVIPDVVGPVTVWRYWAWAVVDRVLRSPLRGTRWLPDRRLGATCNTYGHPAPDPGCLCGIHGLNTAEAIANYVANYAGGLSLEFVFGQVELSGRAIQGEHGWRAAQAQIVSLVDGPGVGQLADRYGVPIIAPPRGFVRRLYGLNGVPDGPPGSGYPPGSASPAAVRLGHDTTLRRTFDGHLYGSRAVITIMRNSGGRAFTEHEPTTSDAWYEVVDYHWHRMVATIDPRHGRWTWNAWIASSDRELWVTGPARWIPHTTPGFALARGPHGRRRIRIFHDDDVQL